MEIRWKQIQQYLKHIAQVAESAIRTKRDLFRKSARLRLIQSAEEWIGQHYEARNGTSNSYNPQVANVVFKRAE